MAILLVVGLSMSLTVQALEKKIRREALPPAVEKTVVQQSRDAAIRGFPTGIDKGNKIYDGDLTIEGNEKDISMDEQGNVVEVEEAVSRKSLPPTERERLTKSAGTGVISKVESLFA